MPFHGVPYVGYRHLYVLLSSVKEYMKPGTGPPCPCDLSAPVSCVSLKQLLRKEPGAGPCVLKVPFPSAIRLSVWKTVVTVKQAGTVSFLGAPITEPHVNFSLCVLSN